MKRIVKSDLDQFYTKIDVVKELLKDIDLSKYKLVIDPSCGDGAFYLNINHPNKIAIDLDPKIPAIKENFLNWNYSGEFGRDEIIFMTNPPFGKSGSIANKFIKKACSVADSFAFILPISYKKESFKNRIPVNYHLILEKDMSSNSFLLNDEDYEVKCVFQFWKNLGYPRKKEKKIKEVGFRYVIKTNSPDISVRRVGVYAGKAFHNTDKSITSHYFIKFENKIDTCKIVDELNKIVWKNDYTVGPRSISKNELNIVLNTLIDM
jgi:predicted RNA methylase